MPYAVHRPLVNKFAKIIERGKLFADFVLITVKIVESGAANYYAGMRYSVSINYL